MSEPLVSVQLALDAGRWDAAEQILMAADCDPDFEQARLCTGRWMLARGVGRGRRWLGGAPGAAVVRFALGECTASEVTPPAGGAQRDWYRALTAHANRDFDTALAALSAAIQQEPRRLDWQLDLLAWSVAAGKSKVIANFWPALPDIFRESPRWRLAGAWAWAQRPGDIERALSDVRAAVAQAPGCWQAQLGQADLEAERALAERIGDLHRDLMDRGVRGRRQVERVHPAFTEALAAARRAWALEPSMEVRNDLGAVLFNSGVPTEALSTWRAGLGASEPPLQLVLNVATAWLTLGETSEMRAHLSRYPVGEKELLTSLGAQLGRDPSRDRQPASQNEWRWSVLFSGAWWRTLPGLFAT